MRERLTSVDSAWFHLERPENTADVVALLSFEEVPPLERVRALVEERVLPLQRFRDRVTVSFSGAASWEADPEFDLGRHVSAHRLKRGRHALEDFVSQVATEPLDPAHPLWRLWVVTGAGEAAIVAKLHHCIADGFALVALLLSLADERADVPSSHHALAAYRKIAHWLSSPADLLAQLRGPFTAARLGLQALGLGAALARMAGQGSDPASSLKRPLQGVRRVAWSKGFPVHRVRRGAHARGVTMNDLLVGALAGALRAELADGSGADLPRVRALVPVNLRPGPPDPSEGALGNRFGLVFLELPLDEATDTARVEAVRASMSRLKGRPDALAAFGALAALGLVPQLAKPVTRFFASKASLVITNVPGPKKPLHLGGRRIEHAMFWVPHPASLGLGVSILTYAGEVRVGVRADVGVLADPRSLAQRFDEELGRLTAEAREA